MTFCFIRKNMEILISIPLTSLANRIFTMFYGIFLNDLLIIHISNIYLFHIEQEISRAREPTIKTSKKCP